MKVSELDMPGGYDFTDVTRLFEAASAAMAPDEVILTDGFELQDAMVAFEIGEPRMDSGMIPPDELTQPIFDPLAPLLPEEASWLLDRSFACELEWHTGSTLSQTVYTFLYVHNLDALSPDFVSATEEEEDPLRPRGLLQHVIRAATFGLLKCCDMAWREMNRNRVIDGEDWQAEKCEVSLLEGVQTWSVLRVLDEALRWISGTPQLSDEQRQGLHARLSFRKIILELLTCHPRSDRGRFGPLLAAARAYLTFLTSNPSPEPANDSVAQRGLDMNVIRRLHTYMPLRPLVLPTQARAWEMMAVWIDGWEELFKLIGVASIATWDIAGRLRQSSPRYPIFPAYIRSLTQSLFYNDVFVLDQFAPLWVCDRFMRESLGVSFHSISRAISERWPTNTEPPPLRDLERGFLRLLTAHIKSLSYTPPRARRAAMQFAQGWAEMYATLARVVRTLDERPTSVDPAVLRALPCVAVQHALAAARDIILSGFALELYAPMERAQAYYFAACALGERVKVLAELQGVPRREGSVESEEAGLQLEFDATLRCLCLGFFGLTILKSQQTDDDAACRAFARRYKWAIPSTAPSYPNSDKRELSDAIVIPDFDAFVRAREAPSAILEEHTPQEWIAEGKTRLRALAEGAPNGMAEHWADERREFFALLAESTTDGHGALTWDPKRNPWFPVSELKP